MSLNRTMMLWGMAALLASFVAAGCDNNSVNDKDVGEQDGVVDTSVETEDDAASDPDIVSEEPAEELQEDPVSDGQDAPADDATTPDAPPLGCESFVAGWNRGFMVDGISRDFILTLPTDAETGGPWPVIFNWHGMGDTADNMNRLLSGSVNNSKMPFILVTPDDTNFVLAGLMTIDWDIASVDAATNRELRLFDEVLACLETRYGVDESHIHSVGFSMGSFVTDAIGTARGERIASLATYSGAYGSNPENLVGLLARVVIWPAYSVANRYTQLFVHGGTSDTFSLGIQTVQFDQMAQNDVEFLNDKSHDAIICNHGGGHTVPSGLMAPQLIEFFAAHPLGTVESPFEAGFPSNFPNYCTFMPY